MGNCKEQEKLKLKSSMERGGVPHTCFGRRGQDNAGKGEGGKPGASQIS